MTQILISFCNVFPQGLALGVYDYDKEEFGWIDTGKIHENIMGANGITVRNEYCYIITQLRMGGVSGLSTISRKDLQFDRNYDLIETTDAHSLIAYGDGFLVADTGKNRLIKITLTNDHASINETEFWKYNDDRKDTVHVNSVASIGNQVYVTLFGTKPEEGWKEAKSGKVIDISKNKIVFGNLHHPHSITAIDETLYWLESGTGIIHKYSEKKGHEPFLKLDGYLRGMTFDKKYLYVASSGLRRKSRSTGVINIQQSSSKEESNSWLYKINRKNGNFEKKVLSYYGSEIYDLHVLEKRCDLTRYQNPIIQRLWKCEDTYFNLEGKITEIDRSFRSILRKYIENLEWEKATPLIEQILKNSEDAEMEYYLAFILQSKREMLDKSLKYYDLAMKHGFDEFWIRYNRGQLYVMLGSTDLAIIDLEQALTLHPNNENVLALLNNLKNKQ